VFGRAFGRAFARAFPVPSLTFRSTRDPQPTEIEQLLAIPAIIIATCAHEEEDKSGHPSPVTGRLAH
jgi:hypothetical protein